MALMVSNICGKRSSKKRASYIFEAERRCFFRSMLLVVISPVKVLARVTCAGQNKATLIRLTTNNEQLHSAFT